MVAGGAELSEVESLVLVAVVAVSVESVSVGEVSVELVSVEASPEPVSVELPAELVSVAVPVELMVVGLSEEPVVSEDVELVRLVQLSLDVALERSVPFRLDIRARRSLAETTYVVVVVFALPVTFELERDEVSVRSVVLEARERRRIGFRETSWRGCGN